MQKYFITGTFLHEKEEISTLTIFNLLSFLLLWNIRRTYSKYFQNNIYETDISYASQR